MHKIIDTSLGDIVQNIYTIFSHCVVILIKFNILLMRLITFGHPAFGPLKWSTWMKDLCGAARS